MAGDQSTAGFCNDLDVFRRIALVGDHFNEALAVLVLAVQIVASFDEETDIALEVIDAQATVALDQLVQRRLGHAIGRFELEERFDVLVADFFANHLLLVFTHTDSN